MHERSEVLSASTIAGRKISWLRGSTFAMGADDLHVPHVIILIIMILILLLIIMIIIRDKRRWLACSLRAFMRACAHPCMQLCLHVCAPICVRACVRARMRVLLAVWLVHGLSGWPASSAIKIDLVGSN